MVASADGGRSFTTQELVSDLEHFKGDVPPNEPNTPTFPVVPQTGTEATNPQIVFTQGTSSDPGGQMMVYYNDTFTNYNRIYYDVSRPDGGVASTPVAAAKVFSNTSTVPINDAQQPPQNSGGTTGGTAGDIPGITNDTINVDLGFARRHRFHQSHQRH